ncbi:MAG: Slp family lipoprotein [Nitrospira sp.]
MMPISWSPACRIIFKNRYRATAGLFLCAWLLSGCAQSAHQSGRDLLDQILPDQLQQQIDHSVSFPEVKANPSAYQGKTIMVSGIVVKSKRRKDETEIEVLQIPNGNRGCADQGSRALPGQIPCGQER